MSVNAEQRSGPVGATLPAKPMRSSTAMNEDGHRYAKRNPVSPAGSAPPGTHRIGASCQSVSGQEMVW
jgi:hypothetical protein